MRKPYTKREAIKQPVLKEGIQEFVDLSTQLVLASKKSLAKGCKVTYTQSDANNRFAIVVYGPDNRRLSVIDLRRIPMEQLGASKDAEQFEAIIGGKYIGPFAKASDLFKHIKTYFRGFYL